MTAACWAILPGPSSAIEGRAQLGPIRLSRSISTGRAKTSWRSVVRRRKPLNSIRSRCFSNGSSSGPSSSTRGESLPSLHSLLGLESRTAELSQIKAAYRKMALKYHPDVSPPENRELNTKIFLQVQDAYNVLSDPISRDDYDLLLTQKVSGFVHGWDHAVARYRNAGKGRRAAEMSTSSSSMVESWKAQWEAQLERLRSREEDSMSWGARMRCHHRYS